MCAGRFEDPRHDGSDFLEKIGLGLILAALIVTALVLFGALR